MQLPSAPLAMFGSMEDLFVTLYLFGDAGALVPAGAPCLAGFAVASAPRASSETPTRATNRSTKRRRLKNADCEVAFFFMIGYGVNDWSLECEASLYLTNQQNVKTFVKNIEKTFEVYPGSSVDPAGNAAQKSTTSACPPRPRRRGHSRLGRPELQASRRQTLL